MIVTTGNCAFIRSNHESLYSYMSISQDAAERRFNWPLVVIGLTTSLNRVSHLNCGGQSADCFVAFRYLGTARSGGAHIMLLRWGHVARTRYPLSAVAISTASEAKKTNGTVLCLIGDLPQVRYHKWQ